MPLTLSDLDLEAIETINCTIDQVMALDDDDYMEASEKLLAIIRKYLEGLLVQDTVSKSSGILIFNHEGGRA